jgi:microcystin-dependent protein
MTQATANAVCIPVPDRVTLIRRCLAILIATAWLLAVTSNAAADVTQMTGGNQSHTNMQPSLPMNHIIAVSGESPQSDSIGSGGTLLGEVSMFAGNFAPRGWALADGQLLPISQHDALFSLLGTIYGGDGETTFALPDLRGRTAVHNGHGPSLSNRPLGQKAGVENVTLNVNQIPSHSHTLPPTVNSTFNTGGSQAHANMQPFQALTYNIALVGLLPSRDSGIHDDTFIGEVRRCPSRATTHCSPFSGPHTAETARRHSPCRTCEDAHPFIPGKAPACRIAHSVRNSAAKTAP